MPKKMIQIPIDEALLDALDSISRKRRQSRSALIREACQRYLKEEEQKHMDEIYREGYKRHPEEQAAGLAQVELAGQILPPESW